MSKPPKPPKEPPLKPTDGELDAIKQLLQDNPESPLAGLLQGAFAGAPNLAALKKHQPALNALVGLLRARSREAMQLAILQLHSSVATGAAASAVGAPSAHPSPGGATGLDLAMSPMALSALLTPSGTGYRVDFEAALEAMRDGVAAEAAEEPLDEESLLAMISSPSPRQPFNADRGKSRAGRSPRGSMLNGKRQFPAADTMAAEEFQPKFGRTRCSPAKHSKTSSPFAAGFGSVGASANPSPSLYKLASPGGGSLLLPSLPASADRGGAPLGALPPAIGGERQRSVNLPPGRALPELSVCEAAGPGPDSLFAGLPSLSQAPLSALLSAAGFRFAGGFGSLSPNVAGLAHGLDGQYHARHFSSAAALPAPQPLSCGAAVSTGSSTMLKLDPLSVAGFLGDAARLLEEALASPLSSQLSAARKSPRFQNPCVSRFS